MEKIQPATDLQLSLMKQFWAAYGEPPHVRPLNATLLKKDFLSLIARVEQGTGKLPITRVVDVEERFARAAASPAGVGVETASPWQSMDSAPTDGTEFIAVRRWPSGNVDAHVYKYEGHPNYWHCKRDGVCIRPDYQESYLWAPLPAALKGDEQ